MLDVNAVGLCGRYDWRMPTIKELEGIVSFGSVNPAIDTTCFPNATSSLVWSASPNAGNSSYAWYVYFSSGHSYGNNRYSSRQVRLVCAADSDFVFLSSTTSLGHLLCQWAVAFCGGSTVLALLIFHSNAVGEKPTFYVLPKEATYHP